MKPIIEFCVNNLTSDVLEIMKTLEADRRLDVIEYGCLGYCGICATQPYALVNGDMVKGETAEELLEKIYKAIEDMQISF